MVRVALRLSPELWVSVASTAVAICACITQVDQLSSCSRSWAADCSLDGLQRRRFQRLVPQISSPTLGSQAILIVYDAKSSTLLRTRSSRSGELGCGASWAGSCGRSVRGPGGARTAADPRGGPQQAILISDMKLRCSGTGHDAAPVGTRTHSNYGRE
jgi:hypothetical protein